MLKQNPVFNSLEKDSLGIYENDESYKVASYTGIALKTFFFIAVAIVFGLFICISFYDNIEVLTGFLALGAIVGFIACLLGTFFSSLSFPMGIIYSACEGVLLVALTLVLESVYPGISLAALFGTGCVFIVMLFLFVGGIVTGGNKLRTFVLCTLLGIILLTVVLVIVSIFDGGQLFAVFYGYGIMSLLLCGIMVILGALMLSVDFRAASNLVECGGSKKSEWKIALGLMVSLVYLYIQILRLLVILFSHKD